MNKRALIITGANGLLGNSWVNYFKDRFDVYAIDLSFNESCFTDNEINWIVGDITKVDFWLLLKNTLIDRGIFLHGIVNAAAITNNTRSKALSSYDNFIDTLAVNVGGPFNSIEVFMTTFREQGFGRIVNIGSLYSIVSPTPRLYEDSEVLQTPGYTASKHGLIGLTKFYASQLIVSNITVNNLSPGGVFDNQDSNFYTKYIAQNPAKRMASPEDFIPCLEFLLSEDNSYTTGQNIAVDGGWTII